MSNSDLSCQSFLSLNCFNFLLLYSLVYTEKYCFLKTLTNWLICFTLLYIKSFKAIITILILTVKPLAWIYIFFAVLVIFRLSGYKYHVFSSVTQSCLTLCDPMNCSNPGLPVHHQLPELAQIHVHRVSDTIQTSHPLSSPSPPAFNFSQHQGLSQGVSFSHQVARILQFQSQCQSFQWIFITDFLQDWLVGSPCSPRDSQESSPTPQFKSINSLAFSFLYGPTLTYIGLPWWLRQSSICLQWRRPGFDPWVRKIPWRRKWQPTPVHLPGKFHGLRRLVGYSPWSLKESDKTEVSFSHPYMTPGKTIALTRWTFAGKVMSLLFNMLFRLVIAFLPRRKYLLISSPQSQVEII